MAQVNPKSQTRRTFSPVSRRDGWVDSCDHGKPFLARTLGKKQKRLRFTAGLDACLSLLNTVIFAQIPSEKNLSLAGVNSN